MNTDTLQKDAVALVSKDGDPLPLHMHWSEYGRTLTVRPQVSFDKESEVSLYISPGITALDGNKSKDMYQIKVNIQ